VVLGPPSGPTAAAWSPCLQARSQLGERLARGVLNAVTLRTSKGMNAEVVPAIERSGWPGVPCDRASPRLLRSVRSRNWSSASAPGFLCCPERLDLLVETLL